MPLAFKELKKCRSDICKRSHKFNLEDAHQFIHNIKEWDHLGNDATQDINS